jgi:hypothetical protein
VIDGYGNSYHKRYLGASTNADSAFTPDYTDTEYQALAVSLVQSSPNSTKYQQYLGFFGAGNRFPAGTSWELMANDNYRKVALNLGTTTTARSDNYEVMLPSGEMNTGRTWKDIAFGANKFIAIAQNGFEWSVGGGTWNECIRPADAVDYVWNTITYMPSNGNSIGRFYTVAQNSNKALTSTDGVTWTYTTNLPASADYRSSESSSDLSVFIKASSNTCVASNHNVPAAYTTQTLPSTKTWTEITHGYHYSTHTGTADNTIQYTSPTLTPSLVDGHVKHNITKSYMTVNGQRTGVSITPVSLVANTNTTYFRVYQDGSISLTIGQSDVSKVSPSDHWGDWTSAGFNYTFKFDALTVADSGAYTITAVNIDSDPGFGNGSVNWAIGDRMLIKGSKYGGVDGVNDIIITVTDVGIRTSGGIVNPTAIWRLSAAVAPGNTMFLALPGYRVSDNANLVSTRNTTTGVYTRTLNPGSGYQVDDEISYVYATVGQVLYPLPSPRTTENLKIIVTSVNGTGGITGLKFTNDNGLTYWTLPSTQSPELNTFGIRLFSNTSSVANTPADMSSRLEINSGYTLGRNGDVYNIAGSFLDGGSSINFNWADQLFDTINQKYYWGFNRGPATATIQVRMTPGSTTPSLSIVSGGSGYPSGTASINGSYCGGTSSQAIEFNITTNGSGTITGINSVTGTITAPTLPTFRVGKLGSAYNNITLVGAGTGISADTQFKFLGSVFNGVNGTNDLIVKADTTNLTRITGSNLDGRVLTVSKVSGITNWTAATFKIKRNKKVNTISVITGGTGHQIGNPVKIDGADIGGNSTHDITITPTAVSSTGAITAFTSSYYGFEGRFVAVGNGTDNAYSLDGLTWTACTLPNQSWTTLTYTKNSNIYVTGDSSTQTGLYIAGTATNNVIAISIDGINWTQKTLPKSSTWKEIAFFKDRFIILDGSRYPLISNRITSLDADPANITLTWSDYGEEYLGYWTSTEMTDLVYIGVGKGTLPSGAVVPLVWKSTTLSGAKATWRVYGTESDLGQLSNIINVGGDFTFIAEDNAATPGNAVNKFTSTFINDATTTGYFIPTSQTAGFPGSDAIGYTKIESTGSKLYLTKKDGSVITYDIS